MSFYFRERKISF